MSDTLSEMMTCTKCGELKPHSDFYKSKRRNGLSYTCRQCHRSVMKGYKHIEGTYAYKYRRFDRVKRRAKEKGLAFELTVDDYWSIKSAPECHYCKASVPDEMTIDRRDNSLGYTRNNVVPACALCNDIKANIFDEAEMLEIGKVVKMNYERRRLLHKEE